MNNQQVSFNQENTRFTSHCYIRDKFTKEYNRFYKDKTKAAELYVFILINIKKAISEGNFSDFERFCKLINFISDLENQALLKTFYDHKDNPIKSTNLIILACKYTTLYVRVVLNYLMY